MVRSAKNTLPEERLDPFSANMTLVLETSKGVVKNAAIPPAMAPDTVASEGVQDFLPL